MNKTPINYISYQPWCGPDTGKDLKLTPMEAANRGGCLMSIIFEGADGAVVFAMDDNDQIIEPRNIDWTSVDPNTYHGKIPEHLL